MNRTEIIHNCEIVYKEIFVEDVYQLSLDEVSGKGVLDLGGHYGLFALYCASKNAKSIISVEPNHLNLNKFIENTKNINTKVICAAVSPFKDMITTIDNNGCGSRTGIGSQLVSTITLSSLLNLFNSSLDLILKVDIEGAEYDLFYRNDPELFKRFKIIVLEAHNHNPETLGDEANRLCNYIENLGYNSAINGLFWAENFKEKHGMPPAYSYKFTKK